MNLTKFYSLFHIQWIIPIISVLALCFLIEFAQKKITCKFKQSKNAWNGMLWDCLRQPLSALIWLSGIYFVIQTFHHAISASLFSAIALMRHVGIIAILSWFFFKLEIRLKNLLRVHKADQVDTTTLDAISIVLRVTITIITALFLLQAFGFSLSGIIAFGGIGGIAIGFAAKDFLANIFSAFMLYWDRPFKVGDWIRSPDKEIEGVVEQIGWRLTRIRTFEKRPIYVPNSIFASISIENPSRMSHRRIYETIGIRYEDAESLRPILTSVQDILLANPEIDQSQTLMVNLVAFGSSSLDFCVYAFTHETTWHKFQRIKEEVLFKILETIHAHDAQLAYPTSLVHMTALSPPKEPHPPFPYQDSPMKASSASNYTHSNS